MSSPFYPLPTPTQRTETNIVSSYVINRIDVTPETCAFIALQLYDPEHRFITSMNLAMMGAEYQAWTEDTYLFNWINQQIYAAYPIPE